MHMELKACEGIVAGKVVRAAIVGASTLLGKELANELNGSDAVVWDLTLLDAEVTGVGAVGGQIASAGDEAVLIQTIQPGAFAGMDVVLFASDAATTRKHWKEARDAGAAVVDASDALNGEAGVVVRSPWIEGANKAKGRVVSSAHPAAVMLAMVMTRLRGKWADAHAMATVLEPASQQGNAGLDEMHQQTVALLSFQPVPKDVYDAQVAFNLAVEFGADAKVKLAYVAAKVRRDVAAIAGEDVAAALALQLVQAPVFNGYAASVFVELGDNATQSDVEAALLGGLVSVVDADDDGPSNLSATEQGQLLIRVRADGRGFWLWIAVDNLKLAAQNAAACASELVAAKS
jgi:aspartate-semialdehyde dehydrogenase